MKQKVQQKNLDQQQKKTFPREASFKSFFGFFPPLNIHAVISLYPI